MPKTFRVNSMRYSHIIWDWNGTLLNDIWLSVEVINSVAQKYNLKKISQEEYQENFSFPVINFYNYMGFDFTRTTFEEISIEYVDMYNARRHECSLHDGARDFLETAKNSGISQSVLSAYRKDFLNQIITHHNIEKYFDFVSGLDDVFAASKLELGLSHIEKINVPKSQILMIGDTLHDLEVAHAMGVDCILMSHGHHSHKRLEENSAPVVETFCALASRMS